MATDILTAMKPKISVLLLAGIALLATPAIAKPGKGNSGKGNSGKGGPPAHAGKGNSGKSAKPHPVHGHNHPGNKGGVHKFNDNDHLQFRNFFAPDNRKNLPPGLQKNLERGKPLPPGWQKKVAAGNTIEADWLKLMAPVSYDYFPKVQRTPGTRLYYHDNRLIRVNEETRIILDVINLLMR